MVSRRVDNAFMALLSSYHSQRFCRAALSARNGIATPPRFSTSALLCAKPAAAKKKEAQKPVPPDPRKQVRARMSTPKEVAIIGSGITGLTTAHYLAKWLPTTSRITIYDAADRTGGWINTQTVNVDVGGVRGPVRFERGPRTLRGMGRDTWKFDDYVLFDLLRDTDMIEQYVGKESLDRYIYYDERLVKMDLLGYWNEPIFSSVFRGAFRGLITAIRRRLKARKEAHPSDMSVAEFVRFATGQPQLVDNLVSAMIHGIWGGDAEKISMRSFMPAQWWRFFYEPRAASDDPFDGHPRHEDHMLIPRSELHVFNTLGNDEALRNYVLETQRVALVTFRKGLGSLPDTIEKNLRDRPNVTFKLGEPVVDLRYSAKRDKAAILTNKSEDFAFYDKVISTTTSNTLYNMTSGALPSLADSPNVSIMAVNLWYPQPRLNKKHSGVGYLVPRSEENNPEGVLGVFFDSDVLEKPRDEPDGTKFFVLLGGHYWNDRAPPTEQEGIEMAKSALERQLGIPASTPCFSMAHFAKDCIPQHHVGHWQRMDRASSEIEYSFNRRVAVAGGSYGPIGVTSGIRAGYDLAWHIARASQDHVGETGLGAYQERKPDFFLAHRMQLRRVGRTIAPQASWFYRMFG